MEEQKTNGVKTLGSLLLACSIFGFFAGFLVAMSSGKPSFIDTAMRYFGILFPLSCLVASIGLLRLKNWGRSLTIGNVLILSLGFSFGILSDFRAVIKEDGWIGSILMWIVIIGLSAKIIHFLTRPKVKEQFQYAHFKIEAVNQDRSRMILRWRILAIFSVIIIVAILVAVSYKSAKEKSLDYFNKGLTHFDKNNYDQAISYFSKAINLNPNNPESYYNRGLIYSLKNDFDQAIYNYNEAIKLNSQWKEPYINRGIAYYYKNSFDAAISDLTEAIKLNPEDQKAYYNRGLAYCKKNNFSQAISDFSKAIQINKNYLLAYDNRAFAYFREGNFEQAMHDLNKAIEIDPNHALTYVHRAEIYFEKKDYEKSWEDVHKLELLGKSDQIDRGFLEKLKKASGREE
ncbi:MAG: tetratricopeptide repeat protein [Candidatus Omnitrophica bacterium]|nr:tetratricopeptide repeat protein [Candidatus Omnitrophota bacterium]